MTYDNENIFAKILRSEIPCEKVFEDEFIFSFKDIFLIYFKDIVVQKKIF